MMPHDLPELLLQRLRDAGAALDQSGTLAYWRVPVVELRTVPIWHRQAIYDALGPPSYRPPLEQADLPPERRRSLEAHRRTHSLPLVYLREVPRPERSIGHLRRTFLTLLTLEYIMPIWETTWYPIGLRTHETVPKIMADFRKIFAGEPTAPNRDPDYTRAFLDDAASGADVVHVAVGRACMVALGDIDFQLYPLPPFRSDEELDELRFDIPGLAAAAVIAPGEDRGRLFWDWWLTEAVPAAWRAFPEEIPPGRPDVRAR